MKTLRIGVGCTSIAVYMLLFAAGVLIDSAPYRARLAPAAGQLAAAAPGDALPPAPLGVSGSFNIKAFLLVMVLYTPLNVAFLTLTAAFVGGCASLITYERATRRDEGAHSGAHAAGNILFRTENPFASMFRGFVVYLAFMAGIYVTTANPFESPTAEQYVRLASTLSLFGFIVGYDPTKFAAFLRLLPAPGSAGQK